MNPQAPPDQVADFVVGFIMLALVTIGLISMLVGWITRKLDERAAIASVNDYADDAPVVMSRSEVSDLPSPVSVSQTDSPQSSDRQPTSVPTREQMLDIYKLLREYNVPRERARAAFKVAGLPLDNNAWTAAKPAEVEPTDEIITPYAGRRTKASYYPDDMELEYSPPSA